MAIVDSHIHLWSKGTPRGAHRQAPYTPEQAVADMNAAGVDAAIITPPAWDADSNEYAFDAARRYPDRFAVFGNFPLDAPDAQLRIAHWKAQPGSLGLRYILNEPRHASWFEEGPFDWFWSGAQEHGIPVALAASHHLPRLASVAQRFPDLRLIVDHLGVTVDMRGSQAFDHVDRLVALAAFPNIAVKASAVPCYAEDAYPYTSLHPYLRRIFDAFGAARIFWGTDITKMPGTWSEGVRLFTDELNWLSPEDKRLILGDALCEWIGWRRG